MKAPTMESASAGIWILGSFSFIKMTARMVTQIGEVFVQDRHIALRRMAGGIEQGDQAQKAKERPPEQIG